MKYQNFVFLKKKKNTLADTKTFLEFFMASTVT